MGKHNWMAEKAFFVAFNSKHSESLNSFCDHFIVDGEGDVFFLLLQMRRDLIESSVMCW